MNTIGLCAFCGTPLAPDNTRRCSCGSLSQLATIALVGKARASKRGEDAPTGDDLIAARELLSPRIDA